MHPKLSNKKHNVSHISDVGRCATSRNLTRVIAYLESIDHPEILTEIINHTGMKTRIRDALNWLVCNGIVLKEKGHNRCKHNSNFKYHSDSPCYRINPEFLKLRPKLKNETSTTTTK